MDNLLIIKLFSFLIIYSSPVGVDLLGTTCATILNSSWNLLLLLFPLSNDIYPDVGEGGIVVPVYASINSTAVSLVILSTV